MHTVQEILYQLFQGNNGSSSSRTHPIPSSSYGHNRTSNERKPSGVVSYDYELQLAVDEALARELQEMEGQLAKTSLNDSFHYEKAGSPELHSTRAPALAFLL